jgi:hypothetical protein
VTHPRRRKSDPPTTDDTVEPAESFVPPESPDAVPEATEHPAKPEAIDKDFTPGLDDAPEDKPLL